MIIIFGFLVVILGIIVVTESAAFIGGFFDKKK